MTDARYLERRGQLQVYFDRTAADAWARLTSTAPVSKIRETVRAGRDRMRGTILDWLPQDLSHRRLLDAGCGTGALSIAAARRGAMVLAIDLSSTLVSLARERSPAELAAQTSVPPEPSGHSSAYSSAEHPGGSLDFRVGDMADEALGEFDHVVAMDSLIHYQAADVVRVLSGLCARTRKSVVFTFAPRTPALAAMHAVGRLFPRKDRAPAIEPVAEASLRARLQRETWARDWRIGRTQLITSGFYKSQAMELVKDGVA